MKKSFFISFYNSCCCQEKLNRFEYLFIRFTVKGPSQLWINKHLSLFIITPWEVGQEFVKRSSWDSKQCFSFIWRPCTHGDRTFPCSKENSYLFCLHIRFSFDYDQELINSADLHNKRKQAKRAICNVQKCIDKQLMCHTWALNILE